MTEEAFTDAPSSAFVPEGQTEGPAGPPDDTTPGAGVPDPNPTNPGPTTPNPEPVPAPSPGPVSPPPGTGATPQPVEDTTEQREAREKLLAALAAAPIGELDRAKLETFLERRVLGHPMFEVAEHLGIETEQAMETEQQLSTWLLAEGQQAVRELMSADHRLWRFLFNYQRGV